jgi:lysophospholipase L1-like esterase
MPHAVLLGDSIFDNAAYVRGGPDVVAQLREALPAGWTASLAAEDGAMASDVARQLRRLPHGATHVVVSAGGNDALGHADLVEARAGSVAEALARLADASEAFERRYRAMTADVLAVGVPVVLCTVYWPRFADPTYQRLTVTALAHFNDAILRVAIEHGLPVIDLRLVCDADGDYANPIEPSVQGGAKIAAAITRVVRDHSFDRKIAAVYPR